MGDPFVQNLIPVLLIGLVSVLARLIHGTWWSPGAFLAAYWFFMIIVPMSLVSWYPVWSFGLWVISLLVFSFFIGGTLIVLAQSSLVANLRLLKVPRPFENKNVRMEVQKELLRRRLVYVIVGLSFIGFLGVFPLIQSVSALSAGLSSITELASSASYLRYHEDFSIPLFTRFAWACIYSAGLLSGVMIAIEPQKKISIVALLPIAASAVYATVLTTKASLLIEIILVFSGFMATLVSIEGKAAIKIKLKTFVVGVFGVCVLLSFFVLNQAMRYGYSMDLTASQREVLQSKFASYIAGHLSAFTGWAEVTKLDGNLTYGARTFAGLAEALGISGRIQGAYELGGSHTTVVATNVFTAWRGLLEDFGLLGAAGLAFVAGMVMQYLFIRLSIYRRSVIVLVSAYYSFVLWSFVISLFQYNTTTICFFVVWVVLFVCSIPRVLVYK